MASAPLDPSRFSTLSGSANLGAADDRVIVSVPWPAASITWSPSQSTT
jgi:hypothetical protein